MFGWLRKRRHKQVLAQPFPEEWDQIIDDNVALARGLEPARRRRLDERVQTFIADTSWEGCGGLELTEEMQVTIAAQACLLTLDRDDDDQAELFRDVTSILVYPSTVITPTRPLAFFEQPRTPVGHGRTVIGEAMLGGPVVLAWDAVVAGGRGETGGNVVMHELAHKLDMATGRVDGSPPLANRGAHPPRVLPGSPTSHHHPGGGRDRRRLQHSNQLRTRLRPGRVEHTRIR